MKFSIDEIIEKKEYYLSLQFLKDNIKKVILLVVVVSLVATLSFYFKRKEEKEIKKSLESSKEIDESIKAPSALYDEEFIFIDIDGAVNNPTVIELPVKSRIDDAIKAAGGLREDADLTNVNRAELLSDGQKIYIPSKSEDLKDNTNKNTGKININTATSDELKSIRGIGEVTAQNIILYRAEKGKFKSIEDIKKVDGIGDKTFEKLKEYLSI